MSIPIRSFVLRTVGFMVCFVGMIAAAPTWAVGTGATGGWVQKINTINMYGVSFKDANLGLAVGAAGKIYRTVDGGKTWGAVASLVGDDLYQVTFANPVISASFVLQPSAWIVGDHGVILWSSDGGQTWTRQNSGTLQTLFGVDFIDTSNGWVVGGNGTILHTTDGGAHWNAQNSLTATELRTVGFTDANNGWIMGWNGIFLVTIDGGLAWGVGPKFSNGAVNSLSRPDAGHGFAAAQNGVFQTMDGGAHWTSVTPSDASVNAAWQTVNFVSLSDGRVGGTEGVWHTTDAGAHWTRDVGANAVGVQTVYSASPGASWMAGLSGVYLLDVHPPSVPGNFVKVPAGDPSNTTTPKFTWTASTDNETVVAGYEASLDQAPFADVGNVLSYTLAAPLTDGLHTFFVRARDGVGNVSAPATVGFVIDTAAPAVNAPGPINATAQSSTVFTAGVTDNGSGVASCNLIVNGIDQGAMTVQNGVASKSYAFASAGSYAMYVHCLDQAGNGGSSAVVSVSVVGGQNNPPPADTNISGANSAIIADQAYVVADNISFSTITITARNAAGQPLSGKTFIVVSSRLDDTVSVWSTPTDGQGVAIFHARSSLAGSSTLIASSGGVTIGSVKITFTEPGNTPNPQGIATNARRLIKLACTAKAGVNDPCKAVYYQGSDSRRHAFPNEKIYFTWYSDFSTVQTIGPVEMASIPLGKNVTYRPGVKMVKFATLDKVYAVSRAGLLRWVTSEWVAQALYGSSWNKHVDDISDAFFPDYHFGADVNAANDFNPGIETANTAIIDVNL